MFYEERREFVAEVQATPGRPTRLLMDAGRYRVQLREPDALYEQRLVLRDGSEASVERDAMDAVPYTEDITKGASPRPRIARGKEVTLAVKGGAGLLRPAIRKTLIPSMPLGAWS